MPLKLLSPQNPKAQNPEPSNPETFKTLESTAVHQIGSRACPSIHMAYH